MHYEGRGLSYTRSAGAIHRGLDIRPDGVYADLTFGGGGHSRAILERLGPKGRLIVFDQDEDAWNNRIDDERVEFVRHNFRFLYYFTKYLKALPLDGILADLGVSSHHFDEAERGFLSALMVNLTCV